MPPPPFAPTPGTPQGIILTAEQCIWQRRPLCSAWKHILMIGTDLDLAPTILVAVPIHEIHAVMLTTTL